jgi:hypothetical protein
MVTAVLWLAAAVPMVAAVLWLAAASRFATRLARGGAGGIRRARPRGIVIAALVEVRRGLGHNVGVVVPSLRPQRLLTHTTHLRATLRHTVGDVQPKQPPIGMPNQDGWCSPFPKATQHWHLVLYCVTCGCYDVMTEQTVQ